jgi:hypothetical protein
MKTKGTTMNSKGRILLMALVALLFGFSATNAQVFMERQTAWKVQTIEASGIDTTRIVHHSFFSLEPVNDTLPLVYHEPYPDSVMPRTAIEIGRIIIQASTADEVVEILEKQARRNGADWIIGFNEPRMKVVKIGGDAKAVYHSEALLYKVIDDSLEPEGEIATVYCGENHLSSAQAVLTWLDKK